MKKIAALLLVTTALSPLLPGHARAGTVIESELPGGRFGTSFATATPIAADVGEIVGNVDHDQGDPSFNTVLNDPDFLDIRAAGFKAFQLVFTASPVGLIGGSSAVSAGGSGSYGALAFATTASTSGGSTPTLTPLNGQVAFAGLNTTASVGSPSTLGGAFPIVASTGTSTSGSAGSPSSPGSSASGSTGGSLTGIVPPELNPILTFYNSYGGVIDSVELDADTGNQVTLGGTLDGGSDLWIGVSTPFDFELAQSFSDPISPGGGTTAPVGGLVPVPEPASAAVLGIGLAALAVAKRKKRPV